MQQTNINAPVPVYLGQTVYSDPRGGHYEGLKAGFDGLFWIDMIPTNSASKLLKWSPMGLQTWGESHGLTGTACFVLPTTEANIVLVGLDLDIVAFDLAAGEVIRKIATLPGDPAVVRCNDTEAVGKDDFGDFLQGTIILVGTMGRKCEEGIGALYEVDVANGTFRLVLDKLTVPNGKSVAGSGAYLYNVDSPTLTRTRFPRSGATFDFTKGVPDATFQGFHRVLELARTGGWGPVPDGEVITAQDGFVTPLYAGGGLAVTDAERKLIAWVSASGPNPTVARFASADLAQGGDPDTLWFVTSQENLSPAERDEYPLGATLAKITIPGVTGLKPVLVEI
jgi:sugar lactone lactonase YvrE